jgi:hypothetical protein
LEVADIEDAIDQIFSLDLGVLARASSSSCLAMLARVSIQRMFPA